MGIAHRRVSWPRLNWRWRYDRTGRWPCDSLECGSLLPLSSASKAEASFRTPDRPRLTVPGPQCRRREKSQLRRNVGINGQPMSHYEKGDGSAIDFARLTSRRSNAVSTAQEVLRPCASMRSNAFLWSSCCSVQLPREWDRLPRLRNVRLESLTYGVLCADDVLAKPAAGRMFVSGRVVDANGQPMPDAAVIVYARPLEPEGAPYRVPTNQNVLGEAVPTRRGGSASRRASYPHRLGATRCRARLRGCRATVPAGLGSTPTAPSRSPRSRCSRAEQLIHGRVFDLQGRPVPNVTLSVASIRQLRRDESARLPRRVDGVGCRRQKSLSAGVAQAGDDRRRRPQTPCEGSAATLRPLSPSTTRGSPSRDFRSRRMTSRPRSR